MTFMTGFLITCLGWYTLYKTVQMMDKTLLLESRRLYVNILVTYQTKRNKSYKKKDNLLSYSFIGSEEEATKTLPPTIEVTVSQYNFLSLIKTSKIVFKENK